MRNDMILDLADCTEFRQSVLARPPRIVHGVAILLITLLGTALLWAALTQADLVVRAKGRVRSVTLPKKIFNAGRGEVLSGGAGGRVVEVNFREGDIVREGQVLIRLDTERLDSDIEKLKRKIKTAEEEAVKLARLEDLLAVQFEAANAKVGAELAQALEEHRLAKQRQASDLRHLEQEWREAADEERRMQMLLQQRAVAPVDVIRAKTRTIETREKLEKARLPVDEGKAEILRRAKTLAEKDFAVKREELALKRGVKQGEVEADRIELASLELERKHAILRSPIDGIVTTGTIKVGDLLEPGKSIVEVAEQKGFCFEVEVASEDIGQLRVGMAARIKLDAYDFQKYGTLPGTVTFISADSSAADGRAVVYTVKIELDTNELSLGDPRAPVKLGMAGTVDIVIDQESLLSLLVKKIRQTISLG